MMIGVLKNQSLPNLLAHSSAKQDSGGIWVSTEGGAGKGTWRFALAVPTSFLPLLLVCPHVTSMRLSPANKTNAQTVLQLQPSHLNLSGAGRIKAQSPKGIYILILSVTMTLNLVKRSLQKRRTCRDLRRELILDSSVPYVVKRVAEVWGTS